MYNDKNDKGNSSKYHTGKVCIEKDCVKPAGTAWGIYWCFDHNVERMDMLTKKFEELKTK